jgi:hypothetical protein
MAWLPSRIWPLYMQYAQLIIHIAHRPNANFEAELR